MGVDAQFYTKEKITFEQVKDVIESEFGVPVEVQIVEDICEEGRDWCQLYFTLKCGESRTLAFFPRSIDNRSWGTDKDHYVGEYGCFHFSCWGKSTEILTRIGRYFGGWLTENDCDDKPDIYIEDRVKKRNNAIDNIIK